MYILTKPLTNNWSAYLDHFFMSVFSGERLVTFVNPCYKKIPTNKNRH